METKEPMLTANYNYLNSKLVDGYSELWDKWQIKSRWWYHSYQSNHTTTIKLHWHRDKKRKKDGYIHWLKSFVSYWIDEKYSFNLACSEKFGFFHFLSNFILYSSSHFISIIQFSFLFELSFCQTGSVGQQKLRFPLYTKSQSLI